MLLKLFNIYKHIKILSFFSFAAIIVFAVGPSVVPFYKQNISNEFKNYNNIYTFSGYYRAKDFVEFRKLIKEDRAVSVGLDPMVVAMNNIKVIDGYHNLYPKKYKTEFREIIKTELEENESLRKYYDNWGSRVYAFVNDPRKPNLNLNAAKKIGAKYLISKFKLVENKNLLRICTTCKSSLFIYKIL